MPDSFQAWLIDEINEVFKRKPVQPRLIVWCDPERHWLDLLKQASHIGGFELWADPEMHELMLRERYHSEPRSSRVVWLPSSSQNISWFKVFEIEADKIWERDLVQALREYGISIPLDQEAELRHLLPSYTLKWFDEPKSAWEGLTRGAAKAALVSDQKVLEVLAGEEGEFQQLNKDKSFHIFADRIVKYFGLPNPTDLSEEEWRIRATMTLLCTEAAAATPKTPPAEKNLIIPPGLPRDNSLKLLKAWQENVNFIPSFEQLVPKADLRCALSIWARNLDMPPLSTGSQSAEDALFKKYASRLDKIENVDLLLIEMEKDIQTFKYRQGGFWERHATTRIGWNYLVELADAAVMLLENSNISETWRTAHDAIEWFCHRGWQLDSAGEAIFEERSGMPDELHRIRARLRRGYLRAIDKTCRAFSEVLVKDSSDLSSLPTSGEIISQELEQVRIPTALVILDACRFDLGQKICTELNLGEPARRAMVRTALAPVPSITPLGMAFALPAQNIALHIDINKDGSFKVTIDDFDGDLSQAQTRRQWYMKKMGVKDFYTINDILEGEKLKKVGKPPRYIIVQGSEFDKAGHEGELQFIGTGFDIERYVKAIRRMRECGFGRVLVITDHGFFHWQPERDEIENLPDGDILWQSRRAVVGHNLKHPSALCLPLVGSNLEVMVPRSVNSFKTYGGVGFFHGGATLQEIIIPLIVVKWPQKAIKTLVVLKPIGNITSLTPRVQLESGLMGQQTLFGQDEKLLSRRVNIKIRESTKGKVIFRNDAPITIEPGGTPVVVQLSRPETDVIPKFGDMLNVEIVDADDEELLLKQEVTLKVDMDEWQ